MREKKVRLSDIAKHCNVQASTVSRVLSGYTQGFSVKDEVRDRILAAAKEMNYEPDLTAKSLRTRKTMNILVLGFNFSWFTYGQILEKISNKFIEKGYTVNAFFGDPKQLKLNSTSADGAIMITASDAALLQKLRLSEIPFIAINDRLGKTDCWVDIDNELGTEKAIDYLLSKGHKKIAYCGYLGFTGHAQHKSITERRSAYENLMNKNKLEIFRVPDGTEPQQAGSMIEKWGVTAVLVYSYSNANELKFIFSGGKKSLQSIEFVTFNSHVPYLGLDRITTIAADDTAIAQETVAILTDKIEKNIVRNITLSPELIPGKDSKRS